jgi:hypothetical protein
MPLRRDYTGRKYNHLTLLEYSRPGGQGIGCYWKAQCDCGTEREVIAKEVIRGKLQTCGNSCPLTRKQQLIREASQRRETRKTQHKHLSQEALLQRRSQQLGQPRECKYCQTAHPLTPDYWYGLDLTNWKPSCKTQGIQRTKRWYQNNIDHAKEYQRNYRRSHPDHRKKYPRNRAGATEYRRRRRLEPQYRLADSLRNRLNRAIHGSYRGGSAVRDLGCTIPELINYLESKFQPGMNWANWGIKGWHIDHIKPLSSFNLSDPEQVRIACHYTNLQPLWATDNLSKGATLPNSP